MKANEFKTYHPIVNLTYFLFVIGFSMIFMHPVCRIISLFSGLLYLAMLKGKKAIWTNLLYIVPLVIIMGIINPLFVHEGVTILAYLPNGTALTLEAAVYGIASAIMLASVICHFSCFGEVITSDKFLYLFGKLLPTLSLILSMTFRFVPKFTSQFKTVANAQRCIGRDISGGGLKDRIKNALSILSIMTTWALENAIETADSMKSRGYGLKKRSTFSIFKFTNRDLRTLIFILALGIYVIVGNFLGEISFSYYPTFSGPYKSAYNISVFTAYLLLCIIPVIIEIWEVIRWKYIKSGI